VNQSPGDVEYTEPEEPPQGQYDRQRE